MAAARDNNWIDEYLSALRAGLSVGDACLCAGVTRDTVWAARKRVAWLAHEEQLIRDRVSVDKLIARLDREGAPVFTSTRDKRRDRYAIAR